MALLEDAARYLRTLAAVERAHSLGDMDDLGYTLGSVDPIELRQVADELSRLGGASKSGPTVGADGAPPASQVASPLAPPASAPDFLGYSVKVTSSSLNFLCEPDERGGVE